MPTVGLEEFTVVFLEGRDIYEVVTRLEIERLARVRASPGGVLQEGNATFELLTQVPRDRLARVAAGIDDAVAAGRRADAAARRIEPVVDMEID